MIGLEASPSVLTSTADDKLRVRLFLSFQVILFNSFNKNENRTFMILRHTNSVRQLKCWLTKYKQTLVEQLFTGVLWTNLQLYFI